MELSDPGFKKALELLSMRDQYFHVIVHQGMDMERRMSFIVEKGQE